MTLSPPVEAIVSNPVRSREDLVRLLRSLLGPLVAAQSAGGARVRLGFHAAHSDPVASELEGFARSLWGIAPLLAAEPDHPALASIRQRWVQGLASGSDPDDTDEFWGWYEGVNQRYVEMAAIGFSIAIAPHVFWDPLDERARTDLSRWLLGSNAQAMPENNWRFFRVLINLGLKRAGGEHDEAALQGAYDMIETFYDPEGFPCDGVYGKCKAYDYYATSFAIPFYSLIVSVLGDDEARAERYRRRAIQNLPLVARLFAPDGSGIPFGRSMAYRFAMSSFFAAVVYAGLELPRPFSLGVIKGLLFRNIRWFTQNPALFHRDGSLSVGYTTPNQFMSENYNCPQSPYWALKSLLVLALPSDHAFWSAEEEPYPASLLATPFTVVKPWTQTLTHAGGHTYLLNAGQESFDHRQTDTKYAKYAYSASFGFSVSTGAIGLDQMAPDSTLVLSDDPRRERWTHRRRVEDATVHDDGWIRSTWRPWEDVEVTTWLVPPTSSDDPYHTRVHRIVSGRQLAFAEGGFAIHSMSGPQRSPRLIPVLTKPLLEHGRYVSGRSAVARSGAGVSAITRVLGNGRADVLVADGNSNLMTPWSVIPILRGEVEVGETWMATRVFASPEPRAWVEEASTTLGELEDAYPFIPRGPPGP